jgi:hypothetical protein
LGAALRVEDVREQWLDPLWRLHNLYFVVDEWGKRVLFRPREAQLRYLEQATERDIILKSRQHGFTTLLCLVSLDECLFNANWRAAIIAHRLDDAKAIFQTKIRYPYDNLPEALRTAVSATRDSADALTFANNSTVSVTTSARSGTMNRLHISEYGKICAQFPIKAREVKTGSLPAAEMGAITIESTAEGQEGDFFDKTQEARANENRVNTGRKSWAFHFFPWHADSKNVVAPHSETITRDQEVYFDKLKYEHRIELTPAQKAWYVATERDLGGDMKREHPSTPDEAFEQAIEGAFLATQLAFADRRGLIGRFAYDPVYPVNTFWDLGFNDCTAIWLHQRVGERNRWIGYYENSGEHISHYATWLDEWRRAHDAVWGDHYHPHDGKRGDLYVEGGRLTVSAQALGRNPIVVTRNPSFGDSVNKLRGLMASCDFDERECATGLKRLRHWRKDWDENRGVWKNGERQDANTHAAAALRTFADGYQPPMAMRRAQLIGATLPHGGAANPIAGY